MQAMGQAHAKKVSLLQEANNRILRSLAQDSKLREQGATQAHRRQLLKMQIQMKKDLQDAKNKANAHKSRGKMIGTLIGAGIGGFLAGSATFGAGGAQGAALGAGAGSQIGGALGQELS